VTHQRPAHLDAFLQRIAHAYGERDAVVDETEALTFHGLAACAEAWAARLYRHGVRPGSHVGLLAGNGAAWLAVAFGVWRLGAVLVPISTFVRPRELAEILSHAGVECLVLQSRLRSNDYEDMLKRMPPATRLHTVVSIDRPGPGGPADRPPRVAPDAASPACILYTSGTTGRPKGVVLRHRAILATTVPTAERSGLGAHDSLLSTLPLFWVAGLVIRALPTLAAGCTLLLVEAFSADAVVAALRRHRPSAIHVRPPQIAEILNHPEFLPADLANVRKGNGRTEWFGGMLSPDARLITGYGMTEMAGYVTALDWRDDVETRRTKLGTLLPGAEMRIVDGQGQPCEAGRVGEIRVRGPGMFTRYHGESPQAGRDDDEWLITGDLGAIDADGTFRFTGRCKDLLRVKGINVSPLEVEGVLAEHPGVETCYVIGLPENALEQRLVALVVPTRTGAVTENGLRQRAERELSHYKRPDAYVFLERHDVPLSGTSKPRRGALAALAARRLARVEDGSDS
jgi:fatty-acyl-CoA synthase